MDISHSEKVEAELDTLVRRRAAAREKSEGARAAEEIYAESVRRFNAQRQQENRAAWAKYHAEQAARHRATLTDLIAHHEAAARKLEMGGAA